MKCFSGLPINLWKKWELLALSIVLFMYMYMAIIYPLPVILTALLHVDLINVVYLIACAFIRSS